MKINDIQNYLAELLENFETNRLNDYSLNGIQVENDNAVTKIAFSVDASIESIEETIRSGSQLLIVHHGFFWGKPLALKGAFKKRIKLLLDHNIGLIAYHLPLDRHKVLGNNAQILEKIGADLKNIEPYGFDRGTNIGWTINLENDVTIDKVLKKLNINKNQITYLDFGNKNINKIAVVSGGGGRYFEESILKNIDLFITGDPDHILYHPAKENKINILFGGHYMTETFGIKALMENIKNNLKIDVHFCNIPTGL